MKRLIVRLETPGHVFEHIINLSDEPTPTELYWFRLDAERSYREMLADLDEDLAGRGRTS